MNSWMMYIAAIACLSPLLTLVTLWQKKEWRVDRLKEHLRSEGWLRQIFGTIRPIIIVGAILTHTIVIGIAVLAGLSILQIVLRRQPTPVWTMKAIILTGTSAVLTVICILVIPTGTAYLFMPILQSIPLLLAWMAFLPVDRALKSQIMNKARALRGAYENITVVGITGSVGKTTTKELIAHLLGKENILFTPAYINSEMGVAKWLLQELPKHTPEEKLTLIIEMGAYRKGEIANLCNITQPHIGVMTYIGTQHIALFGSQEKLQSAKGELFTSLPSDGYAIFNADCEPCKDVSKNAPCQTISVGTAGSLNIKAQDIEETGDGIRFSIEGQKYSTPLHGTHNITNILLAISVANTLGMQSKDTAQRLSTFTPPSSTFAVRKEKGVTLLDDTHNASPESFRAAIAWAKAQPAKNKILITPGLIEQGSNEDRIHRELGTQSNDIFSRVIFTGKHGIDAFVKGYTGEVEKFSKNTVPVQEGDLLVCVGRVSPTVIKRIV